MTNLADQVALAKRLEARTNDQDGSIGISSRSCGLNLGNADESGVVRDEAGMRNKGRFSHKPVELNGELVGGEPNNLAETTPRRRKLTAAAVGRVKRG